MLRNLAFVRHRHPFAKADLTIEPSDIRQSSVLLCAEDNLDGKPIGTLRIEHNRDTELLLWREIPIPEWMNGFPALWISGFAVQAGNVGRAARNALLKAAYLYAVANQCQFIVTVQSPPRDRLYKPLGFIPVYNGDPTLTPSFLHGLPVKALFARVNDFERSWKESNHILYSYMFETFHPSIEVFAPVSGPTRRRRIGDPTDTLMPSTPQTNLNIPLV